MSPQDPSAPSDTPASPSVALPPAEPFIVDTAASPRRHRRRWLLALGLIALVVGAALLLLVASTRKSRRAMITLEHRLEKEDTVEFLAEIYGTTVEDILAANPDLKGPDDLHTHMTLFVPVPANIGEPEPWYARIGDHLARLWSALVGATTTPIPLPVSIGGPPMNQPPSFGTGFDPSTTITLEHFVESGDTIEFIADLYGVTSASILSANPALAQGQDIQTLHSININVASALIDDVESFDTPTAVAPVAVPPGTTTP